MAYVNSGVSFGAVIPWVATVVLLVLFATYYGKWRRAVDVIANLGHDPVTGLPFQSFAEGLIVRHMRRASVNWTRAVFVVVIFTDARGLKEVNRIAGQKGGDVYLAQHADALKGLVRAPDVVFRRGGGSRADELIAVMVVPSEYHVPVHGQRLVEILAALSIPKPILVPKKQGGVASVTMRPHVGVHEGMFLEVSGGEERALRFLRNAIDAADNAMEKV